MITEFDKLKKHLQDDLFGNSLSGDTLYIIDDYNVDYNMSNETLNNFVDAISNANKIKNVYIFIQKKSKKSNEWFLFNYNPRYPNNLEKSYRKKRKFIEAFENKGIDCSYFIYPKFDVKPPFHGRYWLSNSGGFIVDGSINTAENKTVLAQVMDDENFELIRNMTQKIFDINNPDVKEFNKQKLYNAYISLLNTK